MNRSPRRRLPLLLAALLVAGVLAACSSSDSGGSSDGSGDGGGASTSTSTTAKGGDAGAPAPLVFNGQGNNLDAYATEPSADGSFATQRIYETVDTDPKKGRDINAQICFLSGPKGEQWFIAGEDTGQDDPSTPPGWGIFELEGDRLGELSATQVGKLVPTFQPTNDGAENYGCGVLPDGRILTTDIGNQASGTGDGQLIIWFPPFTGGTYPDLAKVSYCKLDVTLPAAQSILVRGDDEVYVAAARGDVYRYTGPFPTSADASGGCGKQDATGAPLADSVDRSVFIEAGANGLATPAGLANAPDDGFYVSSVFSGVIDQFDADGKFVRTILQPPAGEQLGEKPFSTGTPLGIGVAPDGTLFYADIGVVINDSGVGPGDNTGTVRRITFGADGEPQPPETMATDLAFPDGIGIFVPASS